jgi:hypothetical protein
MARYNGIPIFLATDDPKRRFINVKYPSIPLGVDDIYAYAARGDRYDLIASNYYSDSSLWWVISRANPSQPSDSLYPIVGTQIRIPSPVRVPLIVNQYELLNGII